jgi:pimeloyl-ACP methyl ester carboxylesterase
LDAAGSEKEADGPARRARAAAGPRRPAALAAALALLALALFTGTRCYPSGTRVVIFVQGIYTTYDSSGTEMTAVEGHRFNVLKNAFAARGYQRSSLLDFSYAGGTVAHDGTWNPTAYNCEMTDRSAADNLAQLEQMMRDYRQRHPNAHFALVGHSLGGYLAFLEGAREAERPSDDKLGVDVVVTLDAPLKGVSIDKKVIFDAIPCDKTYLAGADIVADKLNPSIGDARRAQTARMAQEGVRLATLGNLWDCLWNTAHCLPGSPFIDDSDTQVLAGEAAVSNTYTVAAAALLSHDAILADPIAVSDAVTFVGTP